MKDIHALVLIVDDNPTNLKVLAGLLRQKNWDFSAASSGTEALAILETILPDVVLLDVSMPGIDGFETCRRIRANSRTASIPVIFLTARVEESDVLKGFAAGGNDYVTKPFQADELFSRAQVHIELCRHRLQVEKLLAQRNELLHLLCHDLDNPLCVVASYTELLRESPAIIDKALGALERASQRGRDIISLVHSMLAVESGKLPLNTVDLKQATHAAIAAVEHRIHEKQIQVLVEMPEGLIVWAETSSLVNSVLGNLLSNAVKFSQPGTRVSLKAHRSKAGQIHLFCRDQGIGMPTHIQNSLFEVNSPTNRLGTLGEKGTGYGMPLVKKLVEAYGAVITVRTSESRRPEFARGTEFEIVFKST